MTDDHVLAATRASCDVMAVEYAEKVDSDLHAKPLDRALPAVFAELTQSGGDGPVVDSGTGDGLDRSRVRGVRPAMVTARPGTPVFRPVPATDLCIKLHACV
ncbi:hypothetical protein [[Kitasatospora] papulosa]|uniref:hypothetical protein n=1 Tax=[Kitasatospora] papulosa TaxID=1464011 RepID=UPI003684DAFE